MKYLVLFIVLSLFMIVIYNRSLLKILYDDIHYLIKFRKKNNSIVHRYCNNNLIKNKSKRNKNTVPKIMIISFDNRPNLDFVKYHNINVQQYTRRWGYEYKFLINVSIILIGVRCTWY